MKSNSVYVIYGDLHKGDFRYDEIAYIAFQRYLSRAYPVKKIIQISNGDGYDMAFRPPFYGIQCDIYHRGNHDPYMEINGNPTSTASCINNIYITHGNQKDKESDLNYIMVFTLWMVSIFYFITGWNLQDFAMNWNFRIGRLFGKRELFRYAYPIMDAWYKEAERNGWDYVVLNHIHRRFDYYRGKICVLGNWYIKKNRTYDYAVIEDGELHLRTFKLQL